MIEMKFRAYHLVAVCLAITLNACSTSLHGSFVATSHASPDDLQSASNLGPIEGRSCQTQPFYVLAIGDQATTDAAIADAKKVYGDTKFIGDISIDDEILWKFGYSVQCIVVRATAYR